MTIGILITRLGNVKRPFGIILKSRFPTTPIKGTYKIVPSNWYSIMVSSNFPIRFYNNVAEKPVRYSYLHYECITNIFFFNILKYFETYLEIEE